MVFSSHLFLFYFLPVALALYYLTPPRGRHLLLTVLSYGFYGWANPLFCVLLLVSTLIDYLCGRVLTGWRIDPATGDLPRLVEGGPRSRAQRLAVLASVVSNLALLGFFKYFNLGLDTVNALLAAFGGEAHTLDTTLRVVLPLGISFYTFQSMSYTLDVYRGHAAPLRSFVDFACYVSLFPQLVAGPIIRYQELADQMRSRAHTWELFARGWALFIAGLGKKVLLANPCGQLADAAFGAGALHTADAWLGAVGYAFQIYFDFSGYSDMAIGLGLLMGFRFPRNFDAPYRATSITDFWRRWHISLSTWLRDYLYLPLGGNRRGPFRTYVNLMLVMLLGGLWHGAAWNFVVWGGLHGLLLALERAGGKRALYGWAPRPVQVALTFLLVLVTWVFFRAQDLTHAMRYLSALAGFASPTAAADLVGVVTRHPVYLAAAALAALVVWGAPSSMEWTRVLTPARATALLALGALAVVIMTTEEFNPFIYFIF
jgi:alginate O-acetyltransferase complex protein AlgI